MPADIEPPGRMPGALGLKGVRDPPEMPAALLVDRSGTARERARGRISGKDRGPRGASDANTVTIDGRRLCPTGRWSRESRPIAHRPPGQSGTRPREAPGMAGDGRGLRRKTGVSQQELGTGARASGDGLGQASCSLRSPKQAELGGRLWPGTVGGPVVARLGLRPVTTFNNNQAEV